MDANIDDFIFNSWLPHKMHMGLRCVGFMQRSVFSGVGGVFLTMALVTRGTDGTPGAQGLHSCALPEDTRTL